MRSKFAFTPVTLAILASINAHATDYDYDGDNKADVAVRRASTAFWYVQNTGDNNVNSDRQDGIQRTQFGSQSTDIPVAADFDGDGITDFAVRRPSTFTWYVKNSSGNNTNSAREDGIQRQVFGRNAADIPVPADYDGDGIDDFAVRRPATFTWYIRNSSGGNFNSAQEDGIQRVVFGRSEDDIPVQGDFNGDGKADIAVWRPSTGTWFVKNSDGGNYNSSREDGIQRISLGTSTDIPVPADYDGDGITDIAVRTPSSFLWTIVQSSNGGTVNATFGRDAADIPVPADYDGDGKADIAVRRSSNQFFYILNSSDGAIQRINFGTQEDDIPVNASISQIMTKLDAVNNPVSNTAPVANAGADQTVTEDDTVQLDGSGSSDTDGDSLSYSWSFSERPEGSVARLNNSNTAMPSFTADESGTFVISLVVNDGTVDSSADSVTITALEPEETNTAPIANAGRNQTVDQGDTVQLNGSNSSDANGDTLTYSWQIVSAPSGSSATLSNATSAMPTFVADVAGSFTLSLVVNDGTVNSDADTVTITVNEPTPTNNSPVANAGADQSAERGDTVQLSGAGSSDADGDSLTYSWSFTSTPSGSSASLNNANSISPSFTADVVGDFVLSLVVNDGTVDSSADSVTISVSEPAPTNTAPVANAGSDQEVQQGATVQLSASGSTDSDGDSLTYSWSFTSRPDSSSATLNSSTSVSPTFVADQAGTYGLSLVVNDGTVDSSADTVSITATAVQDTTTWIINSDGTRSTYIQAASGSLGALVNVESVTTESVNGAEYTKVAASGIPDYQVTASSDLVTWLNNRPKARSDFVNGSTTVSVGDTISFGQDIGYNSNSSCNTGAGFGYWPPGPVCPEDLDREGYFPNEPATTTQECDTGLGVIGYLVNGTSVYGWGDGQSYNNEAVWYNLAPIAEVYDVDICGGHAANGDYHHHFYSTCLADLIGDDGTKHSPLYGYAADGYPIYGPWHANGQLAISSWAVRDYSASSSTGCGSDGVRSCVLVDRYDVAQGTEAASSNGPNVGDEVSTLSGNTLEAYAGYYREDYYWDSSLSAQGGAYLDRYNAHDHDGLGYHYHITVTNEDGTLTPYYPFMMGDRFAGQLQDNAISNCSTSGGGGGPGGGGGGPGGGGGGPGGPGVIGSDRSN